MVARSARETPPWSGSIGGFRAPASVAGELARSGVPLEADLRSDMEGRFGHDFSRVRIHAGAGAGRSAADIRAKAYSRDGHIVFAQGRFAPRTAEGRRLLAHELAHVVQAPAGGPIRCEFDIEDFDAGSYTVKDCKEYLDKIDQSGVIEDGFSSDDKARAAVHHWRSTGISLTPRQMVLLVLEMQSGFTGDDDERAILSLLVFADDADLAAMFSAGALSATDVLSDFHGEEEDRLLAVFDARFEGGRDKALAGSNAIKPGVRVFGSEGVEVSSDADIAEIGRIIRAVKDRYGIELNSPLGVEAVRARYTEAPESQRQGVKTRKWHLVELQALERALKYYEPILGAMRADSTRAAVAQEIVFAAKNEQSIDQNTDQGVLDRETMGEYYGDFRLFGLYECAEGYDQDFPGDVPKQLEGTVVHELAHGLLNYRLSAFVTRFKYWKDESTRDAEPDTKTSDRRRANKDVEAPITHYGTESADEDLAESARFFFLDAAKLKAGFGKPKREPGNPCPERHQFIQETVEGWKAKKPETQGKGP